MKQKKTQDFSIFAPINEVFIFNDVKFIFSKAGKNTAKLHIIDNKTGEIREVAHTTIDNNDNVVHVGVSCLQKVIDIHTEDTREAHTHKENPIEVIRYLRPLDELCGYRSNLYGVTFIFTLDYEKKKIDVNLSVCNGDNFSKKDGVDFAREGKISITNIDMPDYIYNCSTKDSLVYWFLNRFPNEFDRKKSPDTIFNIRNNTIKLINQIYMCSGYAND